MTDTDQQATRDLADDSRYIRTYAKDLASAGGEGSDAPVSPAKSVAQPVPEPIKEPEPLPPPPAPPKAEPVVVKETSAEPEREAILDRLKKRLSQHESTLPVMEAIVPTAPVFAGNVEDVPRMPPLQPTPPVPVVPLPPPIPVVATQPPPPPIPAPRKPEPETASPLHTYKTDFADEIDNKGASTFSVLAAEGNAKQRPSIAVKKKSTVLPVIAGSLMLMAVGAGGVYAAYWFITRPINISLQPLAPSLVFVDERIELKGPDYFSELAGVAKEPLVEGNVLLTYITYSTTSPKKTLITTPLPGGELLAAMDLPAPDILLRNIDRSSTVGIVNAGGETNPFFIMRVTSYERTYAGMLSWEKTIADDLALFYPAPVRDTFVIPLDTTATTTTTTSSSAQILPEPEFFAVFKDEILQNHDVRVLRDRTGKEVMVYGYRDKETLIIARNSAAYLELIRRLTAAGN